MLEAALLYLIYSEGLCRNRVGLEKLFLRNCFRIAPASDRTRRQSHVTEPYRDRRPTRQLNVSTFQAKRVVVENLNCVYNLHQFFATKFD
jgi:hypothetical protein